VNSFCNIIAPCSGASYEKPIVLLLLKKFLNFHRTVFATVLGRTLSLSHEVFLHRLQHYAQDRWTICVQTTMQRIGLMNCLCTDCNTMQRIGLMNCLCTDCNTVQRIGLMNYLFID
jgi:hypothetical protein